MLQKLKLKPKAIIWLSIAIIWVIAALLPDYADLFNL